MAERPRAPREAGGTAGGSRRAGSGKPGSRREVLVLIPGREVSQGRGGGTQDPFQTPAVQAGIKRLERGMGPGRRAGPEGGGGAGRAGPGQGGRGAQDPTHTWSVSVVTRIGQAAAVFHRKLTTHSQLRENMGWVC